MSRLDSAGVFAAVLLVLVLLGGWARLASHSHVLIGGRVELVPADSHYYVRLALLHLAERAPVDSDPFVAFPLGAANYWPPLHTLLVTLLVGTTDDPELGAAFVGPLFGIIGLLAVVLVGRVVSGARAALGAGFVLALTPIAVEASAIGNADHHVHEPIFAALAILLGFGAVSEPRRFAVAAGIVVAASRLFTTVGFVLPPVIAIGFVLAAAAALPEDRSRIARASMLTGVAATITLAAGVLVFGEPLALDYEAFSAFHPLLAATLFAAATATCAWLARERRLFIRSLPFLALGVFLVPQVWRALQHLGRADPLLAIVAESQPLLRDPLWAMYLLGSVLLALPIAMSGAVRALIRRSTPALAVPLVGALLFLAAAAMQARFAPLLSGAAAVMIPTGVAALLRRATPRAAAWWGGVVALCGAALLLVLVPPPPPRAPGPAATIRPTLQWMAANLPPSTPDPYDADARPEYGVLAPFEYGHFVVLYSERPALASTFSQTSDHVRANRTATQILASTDEDEAHRLLRAARLDYVLRAPTVALLGIAQPSRDALFLRLQRGESLGHFRPVHESRLLRARGRSFATVYEVVDGALIEGAAPPGARVTVTLDSSYARTGIADPGGRFRVRVAREGIYEIDVGGRSIRRAVTLEQVRTGARVALDAPA